MSYPKPRRFQLRNATRGQGALCTDLCKLAPDFLQQMTRRYGIAALLQIAAVPVVIAAPRVGVAIALLCVAFFLLPQPRPRYKPGEEPSEAEKLNE
jgi:hypothetical protein